MTIFRKALTATARPSCSRRPRISLPRRGCPREVGPRLAVSPSLTSFPPVRWPVGTAPDRVSWRGATTRKLFDRSDGAPRRYGRGLAEVGPPATMSRLISFHEERRDVAEFSRPGGPFVLGNSSSSFTTCWLSLARIFASASSPRGPAGLVEAAAVTSLLRCPPRRLASCSRPGCTPFSCNFQKPIYFAAHLRHRTPLLVLRFPSKDNGAD